MSSFRVFAAVSLALILVADFARAQADSWQTLSSLKRDDRIVIYLKNGARMKQRFLGFDQDNLVTEVGEIARKDIAAVSLFRPERLWDGTLRGAGIGVATVMIPVAASDHGSNALAAAGLFGFLGGAGLGVLFDAGVAKPDKPVFVNSTDQQSSLRKWTVKVPPQHLSGWIRHQRVHLMLKDGSYVRGTVVDGTETSLQIDVRESSRQSLEGNASVDTAEIGTVIFRQKLGGSTAAAATGGAISGFWAGALAALGASDAANEGPGIAIAALGGALGGGLLAGSGISQMNTREITLVVE